MPAARKPFARVWRRLTNLPWWLPLVLGVVLTLDACSRPNDPPVASSDFGLWLKGRHQFRGSRHPSDMRYVVVRLEDGTVLADEGVYEGKPPRGEVIADFSQMGTWTSYHGLWGMTQRRHRVFVDDDLLALSEADRRACGEAIDRLWGAIDERMNPQRRAGQMLRDGTYTITEPVPSGYIHNTLAITLATSFLWSLTLGRPWRSWAAWKRDYHLSHDRCPRCRYPVHGYPGTTCPECGHDWADLPTPNPDERKPAAHS